MAAYTTIDDPGAYYSTTLYSAGSAPLAITGVGFQPDICWIKSRSYADNPEIFDSVRGATEIQYTNFGSPDDTQAQSLISFDSDGFTVGTRNDLNRSGQTFVSWNWKMGTTTGIDTTGASFTPTGYSFNQDAGQSIVQYTGNITGGESFPHGLGAKPDFILTKPQTGDYDWGGFHKSLNATVDAEDYGFKLNTTSTPDNSDSYWNDTAATTVIVTLGNSDVTNSSGANFAYCFTAKQGYSHFGFYTGNTDADGPFVYTGFRPAFVLVIPNTAESRRMWDNKREGYNPTNDSLAANQAWVEAYGGTAQGINILSNGFKITSTNSEVNYAYDYYYAAFAEAPFVNSSGVPGTAR